MDRDYGQKSKQETVSVPVDEYLGLLEQSILLLGQASLSISYARRLNVLNMVLKDPKQAKDILKEK